MSVHAAYKALMESRVPSKEDVIMQGMCREWIWEFLLRHCTNSALIRALAIVYPVPDGSLHLKRLLLLKSLSFNLSDNHFSDRTLETISALSSLYRAEHRSLLFHVPVSTSDGNKALYQFSLQQLLLAVRVECTVQYLRAEIDDWPKFYESLEKYWGDCVEDTQEPEHNDDDDTGFGDTFSELKEELWAVQRQPELCHELLKKRKREYMKRMMQSFLTDAWKDAGQSFLEGVAQNLRKGQYVPAGFARSMKEGVFGAEKSLPGKAMNVKSSHARLSEVSADKTGTSFPNGLSKIACMPSGAIPEKTSDVFIAKDSNNKIHVQAGSRSGRHAETSMAADLLTRPSVLQGSSPLNATNPTVPKDSEKRSICKHLEKVPRFSARPSLERSVDACTIKDPNNLLSCTELIPIDKQLESPCSRRRIPTSLKQGKKADCNTDTPEAVRKVNMRVTRSSSVAGAGEKDATAVNGASGFCQEPSKSVLPGIPGSRDTWIAETGKTWSTEALEQRGQGAHSLEEEQLMCPSPPPWTGSPGMNGMITTRKRPRLAHNSKTGAAADEVGHVETPVILKAQSELREGQASLIAAVQDPLPEALKIAEDAAKTSNLVQRVRDQTFLVDDENQSMYSMLKSSNDMARAPEGAVGGSQVKPSKKTIMDRNRTAHTVEWETSDDIADSSDDQSPSRSRQVHLPKIQARQSFASRGGVRARSEPHRRKFQKWTKEETDVLRKEVERYGKGHWKHILQKHKDIFESRTEVDLKDKWRNIERREGIL